MTLMMFRYVRGHGYHWTSIFHHVIPAYFAYSLCFHIVSLFQRISAYVINISWFIYGFSLIPLPLVPHIPPWTTTDLRLEIRHQSPRSLPQDAVAWVRRSHHQWKPLISSKYPARDLVSHNITMIWPSLVSHSYMSHHHPKIDGYPKTMLDDYLGIVPLFANPKIKHWKSHHSPRIQHSPDMLGWIWG